ncbi:hypothetical protein BpHYR1_034550 [Brachionus plicatilis]|uniref:Uncharacterized protein n=1 Tax=Brachionus plicatilis TaxID=10195 RepID=A0A3M7R168_BRAPC|nr:hypothetical protein BpHYR1_034550 [Brachionus plicatilis]
MKEKHIPECFLIDSTSLGRPTKSNKRATKFFVTKKKNGDQVCKFVTAAVSSSSTSSLSVSLFISLFFLVNELELQDPASVGLSSRVSFSCESPGKQDSSLDSKSSTLSISPFNEPKTEPVSEH